MDEDEDDDWAWDDWSLSRSSFILIMASVGATASMNSALAEGRGWNALVVASEPQVLASRRRVVVMTRGGGGGGQWWGLPGRERREQGVILGRSVEVVAEHLRAPLEHANVHSPVKAQPLSHSTAQHSTTTDRTARCSLSERHHHHVIK